MNIQSLSIVVPTGECMNDCAYCVSSMHHEEYEKNIVNTNHIIPQSYIDRLIFVRDEGCNSMILTGTTEPQQNLPFIYNLLHINRKLRKPFYNITIQTTGANLTGKDIKQLADAGVTIFALSLSSINSIKNWDIIHTPKKARILSVDDLIEYAKIVGMNVRVCYNLTDAFAGFEPKLYFQWAFDRLVDQVTFRKIYTQGDGAKAQWVRDHEFSQESFQNIKEYVRENGTPIAKLPYNFIQYDVNGISTVIDDDCMAKDNIEEMKYLVLRVNGHLYSRWDAKGSLVF